MAEAVWDPDSDPLSQPNKNVMLKRQPTYLQASLVSPGEVIKVVGPCQ